MKYLLNLPLALAALFQVWFASPVFMSAPWSGLGRWAVARCDGAVMLEPVALAWILLLPVIAGSVFADAFDWLPVHRRWLQLTLVLVASALIGILGIPCVLVAIGESAAVGQTEDKHFGSVLIGGATIAATVVPLIGMAWLAWLIDAPLLARHAALARRISLTALALMALIGGVLGTDMLLEEIAVTRETAARYQRTDDERAAMTRAGFAKLADADPLRNWVGYTDHFTPDEAVALGGAYTFGGKCLRTRHQSELGEDRLQGSDALGERITIISGDVVEFLGKSRALVVRWGHGAGRKTATREIGFARTLRWGKRNSNRRSHPGFNVDRGRTDRPD